MANNKDITLGTSSFWITLILLSFIWLFYLVIWSFQNDNIRGTILFTVFFGMIIAGIILSRFKMFSMGSWSENSLAFTIGFLFWGLIQGFKPAATQATTELTVTSLFSLTQNQLFATIAGQLPQYIEVLMSGFVIPVAEEIFWMFAIPYGMFSILKAASKRKLNLFGKKKSLSFLKNMWLQILLVIAVGSTTFAFFHVGREAFIAFIIGAIIFRSIMVGVVYTEKAYDWLKNLEIFVSFAVGAHIVNNLLAGGGIGLAMDILKSQNTVVYITIWVLAIAIAIGAIDEIIGIVSGEKKKRKEGQGVFS